MTDLDVRDTAAVTDAAGAAPGADRASRRAGRGRRELTRWGWGLAGILAVVLIWEAYKLLGPADGVVLGDTRVLPRTTDLAMPHVWDMLGRLGEPVTRSPPSPRSGSRRSAGSWASSSASASPSSCSAGGLPSGACCRGS